MNYVSIIIILTVSYLMYYGICLERTSCYADDYQHQKERIEHWCHYYKLQEVRIENEK